jgi:hypothetical protein
MTEFARYKRGDGARWRCKRCIGEAVTRRKQKVKRILVAEAGGCCCVCGYDRCIVNFHFHHVDPDSKSFGISMGGGKSLAAFRKEAEKCVLVCANCHGEIEAGLIECPPLGSRYPARWFRNRRRGYGHAMTIGSSLFLIAIGAILRYAITAKVDWIDINTAGLVLMLLGVLGLIIGLYFYFVRGEDPEVAARRPPPIR